MVVNVPKPDEELLEMLSRHGSLFIVACGGCPVGCDSGGQARIDEVSEILKKNKKRVAGSTEIDFLCNKALVGTKLRYRIGELGSSDADNSEEAEDAVRGFADYFRGAFNEGADNWDVHFRAFLVR